MRARRRKLMLVTGGGGFLGRHLIRSAAAQRWELIAPSSTSLDVRRRETTIREITDWRPHVVVHLAYRKEDPATIVAGTRHVAEASAAAGARLVHVSTDLVFPGRAAPYGERDTPFPMIDYGRQKLEAERIVAAVAPSAVTLRTSLLVGTDDLSPIQQDVVDAVSPGPAWRPMRFFCDEIRCPAHADDIAAAVSLLARRSDVTGLVHVAGPEAVSRAELARLTALFTGRSPEAVEETTIAEAGVARPGRIVLDCSLAASLGIRVRPVSEVLRPRTS